MVPTAMWHTGRIFAQGAVDNAGGRGHRAKRYLRLPSEPPAPCSVPRRVFFVQDGQVEHRICRKGMDRLERDTKAASPSDRGIIGGIMHRFEVAGGAGTGNADIDAQLGTLFEMANDLLFPSAAEPSLFAFRREVSFLFSYLEYHFASEELAMLEQGYGSRRFHAAFHDHVRREARAIINRLGRKASIEETRSAIFFLLEDWRVYHVSQADRQLAAYLSERSAGGEIPHLPGIMPLKAVGALSSDFDERVLAVRH